MMVRFVVALLLGQPLLCAAIRSVCHNEMRQQFRCYDLWPPYTNTNFHLPASPTSQGIQFELFTTNNPTQAQMLRPMDTQSFQSSNWNSHRDTKVIVHGFTGSSGNDWIGQMVAELLRKHVNVIVVDWAKGAKGPNYFQAAANTRVVGAEIASLILTAEEGFNYSPSRFHVIGHSLGAQIGGYAGEKLNGRLGRISGLDPAAPLFENYGDAVKVERSDAQFVDIMHTDAEPLHEAGLGTVDVIGHVDFFPNGGKDMPGCPSDKFNWLMLLTGQIDGLTDEISCSHNRAPRYFTASINDNDFQSYPCGSPDGACHVCGGRCGNMGYKATPNMHGLHVLTTGADYPY